MKGRILFLDQGETLGGAERYLIDFLNSLSVQEIQKLEPLLLGGHNEKYKQFLRVPIETRAFSFPSVRGNIFKKILSLFPLLLAAYQIKRIVKKYNSEVVCSNTPRTHFVMLLSRRVFGLNVRWVAIIHDFSIPGFLLKRIGTWCDTLIANSLPARQHAHKILSPSVREKIRIVENALDFSHIPPAAPPQSLKNIVMLGRIDPQKGQMFALQAAKILQEKKCNVEFFIVGSPFAKDKRTMDYAGNVHQFAQHNHLDHVHFLPETDTPFEAIGKADCVLVLPTKPETFGRIVIEALSLGKLVLAFDETGPREILQSYNYFLNQKTITGQNIHGFSLPISTQSLLVEKQNAESLASTIHFFYSNPGRMEGFTIFARKFTEEYFSLTETKKRLMSILVEKN